MVPHRGADERLVADVKDSARVQFRSIEFIEKFRVIESDRLIPCFRTVENLEIFLKSVLKNNFSAKIKHLEYAYDGKHHLTFFY